MNNKGWGLETMLICLAAVGICLITSAVLIRRLENITNSKLVENKTLNQIQYIDVSKNK